MKDRIVFSFDKRELILLLLTFFIFAIAIFFIGFVAGTRFSKGKAGKKIKHEEVKEIKINPEDESESIKYVFPTTRGTEIYVATQTSPSTSVRKQLPPSPSSNLSATIEKNSEKTRESVNKNVPVASKKVAKEVKKREKKKHVKNTPPPVKIKKPFTVQIAAFRKLSDAYNLMRKLQRMGFDAYYERTNIPGKGIWFRVRVGHYRTREEAAKIARKIKSKTGYPAFVTISKKR